MQTIGIIGTVYDRTLVRYLESLGFIVQALHCNAPSVAFDYDHGHFTYRGQPLLDKDRHPGMPVKVYRDDEKSMAAHVSGLRVTPWFVPDFIIDRLAQHKAELANLLRFFEAQGATILNPPDAIVLCANKLEQAAQLIEAGITLPETRFLSPSLSNEEAWQTIHAAFAAFAVNGEIILKEEQGTRGQAVHFISSAESAYALFVEARDHHKGCLLQRPIEQDVVSSIRVHVVDGRVINAVRLIGWEGRRVSNGGHAEEICLSEAEKLMAVRATNALGLRLGGVDLLRGNDGQTYLLEVNNAPGLADKERPDLDAQVIDGILNVREQLLQPVPVRIF